MQLSELINRVPFPLPWSEGDNIPWKNPEFSQRMLQEHLSQAHDAASRRYEIIDQQVSWIHSSLLGSQPTTILDLCCGPGLYGARLAHLGHTIHGIDYSPASIEYAAQLAYRDNLPCTYACQDIRLADFPSGIGLVILIYGEFNVFRQSEAALILNKSWQALNEGGLLLLEPHPFHVIQELGQKPASWYASQGGLFSEQPHLVLQENLWDDQLRTTTIRYFVIEADTCQVKRYAQSFQAYQDSEYEALLSAAGFGEIRIFSGLTGEDSPKSLIAISARKLGDISA